ncbi:cytochrome P450 [Chiua virens]|nr:cytochrome P450 [Chiua virens]
MLRFMSPNSILTLVAVGAVVVSVLTLFKGRRRSVRGFRLPPGPVPLPIVGNLFSIDPKKPWITYTRWKALYGDVFMVHVLKQNIIVINSEKIAKDLLERRSSIYSDRPYLATRIPYGWSFNFAFTPYGNQWRSQRRIFHQAFRAEAALAFHPVQLKMARKLILDVLGTPQDYSMHIQRFAARVIMSVVYDYEVAPDHDNLVELFERGNALAMEGLTPETASVIEAFPFVLSLPEWFPGGAYRRKATVSNYCAIEMIEEPFKRAKQRETMGSSASAVALEFLKRTKDIEDPVQLQLLKDTCATAFVAGAETTTSTLQCFMLAMVHHPEVQDRAKAEIDMVVGTNRLPNFDDRPNLPYVEAILMETLRLFFRYTARAMYHNEDVYPEPDVFKPDRFLVDGTLKEEFQFVDSLSFGFGRRMCPGRHTADGSVWAAVVSILCAFKIEKLRDEKGEEIDFEPTFSYGVTTAPYPFPCSITPRLQNKDIRELASVMPDV